MKKTTTIILFAVLISLIADHSIAQWVRTNGPYGGASVTSMATIGTNLFAVAGGGVIRSTDNGANWTPVNNGLSSVSITSIAAGGGVLFAGSNYNYYGSSVYVSTDSGASWLPNSTFGNIGPFTANGSNIFTGTENGVLLSTDNGINWTPENTGLTMYYPSLKNFANALYTLNGIDSLLFAGTDKGLFLSMDNGLTWTKVDSTDVTRGALGTVIRNGADLIAAGNSLDYHAHVYRSTDNGITWSEITHNLNMSSLIGLAANGANIFVGSWYTGVSHSTDNGATWEASNGGVLDSGVATLAMMGKDIFTSITGVYRSTDNGTTWKSASLGISDSNVSIITAIGTDLFAGAWSQSNGGYQQGGIYRSRDKGASWVKVYDGYALTIISVGNDIVAGLYPSGAVRSTDNGNTWSQLDSSQGQYFYVYNLTACNNYLFNWTSGTSSFDVVRSADYGTTWTDLTTRYYQGPVSALASIGSTLFAAAPRTDMFPGGVFRSTDNGGHWVQTNSELTDTVIKNFATIGTNLFAGTASGVFLTTNYGASWSLASTGLQDSNIILLEAAGTTIYATTDSGLFRSLDNGANWSQIHNSLLNQTITSLAGINQNVFASTSAGIFLSTDNGTHWSALGIKSPDIGALAISGQYLFAGGTNDNTSTAGGIFRSSDNGGSWMPSDSGLSAPASVSSFASLGTVLFAAGAAKESYLSPAGGVFRSTDFGASWDTVFGGIGALAISGKNVFTGSGFFDGCSQSYLSGNVYRSSDSGSTWVEADLGLIGSAISALAANGNDLFVSTKQGIYQSTDQGNDWYQVNADITPSTFAFIDQIEYAGGSFGVYRSKDSSVTWQMVNFGLKNQYVNSLATSPGKKLFAATDSGLYYSNDNGTRWMDMSAGLPNTPLLSVLVSSTDLFVGTAGNNVWHRPLSDFPRFESVDQTQPDLTLSISPNPTTGIITVYNVPANIVHVGVTNVLGETIIELTNSGTADFTIDVSKLMPGTYFAKFSSASEVITRKIIKE